MKMIKEVTAQPRHPTREPRSARLSPLVASLCALMLCSACKNDSDTGEGEDGSSGPEENCDDPDCVAANKSTYACGCDLNSDGLFDCGITEPCDSACWLDSTACTTSTGNCSVACGGTPYFCYHDSCINNPNSGTCSSWAPASNITLISGVYNINGTWLAGLVANPAPLWTCDDAYFEGSATGSGFKLKSAVSGDFVYVLGLRTNDLPQTINSLPLATWRDGVEAFGRLYKSGVTAYTLVVTRSGSSITLRYQIN